MKIYTKNKKNGGYAILFTVILVSAISAIAIGLSNTTYKQLILSSVARDSHLAFYQSDTATECALFADRNLFDTATPGSTWDCGIDLSGNGYGLNFNVNTSNPNIIVYTLDPVNASTPLPCFSVVVERPVPSGSTLARAKGYNICDANNLRKVEREIDIIY